MARPESEAAKRAREMIESGCLTELTRQEVSVKSGCPVSTVDKIIAKFKGDEVANNAVVMSAHRAKKAVESVNCVDFFTKEAIRLQHEGSTEQARVCMDTALTAVQIANTLATIEAKMITTRQLAQVDMKSEKAGELIRAVAQVIDAGD